MVGENQQISQVAMRVVFDTAAVKIAMTKL